MGDSQTPLQFVSKEPTTSGWPAGPGAGTGDLIVVVHLGHVDGTDSANVKTVLTCRERPTLGRSPDLTRALTSLEVHHGLTLLVHFEAAGQAQAGNGDCQCQSSTAT